jgi:hypothetical protein
MTQTLGSTQQSKKKDVEIQLEFQLYKEKHARKKAEKRVQELEQILIFYETHLINHDN